MIDKKILKRYFKCNRFLIYRQLKLVSKLTAELGKLTKRVNELESNTKQNFGTSGNKN